MCIFGFSVFGKDVVFTAQTHYYTDNRSLPENRKDHSFRFLDRTYVFTTDDGVFAKRGVDYGTQLLLKNAVKEELSGTVLDLGCGYGVISVIIASLFPECRVVGSDVNSRALDLTLLNCRNNGTAAEAVLSDGFSQIPYTVDAVISNPPIRTGKQKVYALFDDVHAHLKDGGVFLAVMRRQHGAESAVRKLTELFGNCAVTDRDKGFWILRAMK